MMMTAKTLFLIHDSLKETLMDIGSYKMPDSVSDGPHENPNENWDEKEYEVLCDDGETHVISAASARDAFDQAREWQMRPVEVFPVEYLRRMK